MREQTPKAIYLIRGKLYELLANCIPPEVILKVSCFAAVLPCWFVTLWRSYFITVIRSCVRCGYFVGRAQRRADAVHAIVRSHCNYLYPQASHVA